MFSKDTPFLCILSRLIMLLEEFRSPATNMTTSPVLLMMTWVQEPSSLSTEMKMMIQRHLMTHTSKGNLAELAKYSKIKFTIIMLSKFQRYYGDSCCSFFQNVNDFSRKTEEGQFKDHK
jgi:hypothetical protein